MRIYWWQGGLHIEPDTDTDRAALEILSDSLKLANVGQGVPGGPIGPIDLDNHQSVIRIDESLEVVPKGNGGSALNHPDAALG